MQEKINKLHAKKTGCAGLLLAALLILAGCTKKEEFLLIDEETSAEQPESDVSLWGSAGEVEEAVVSDGTDSAAEPNVIWVHVCGAVRRPGVYELQAGSRVYEAVQAAGGFADQADQDYVNQAQKLPDGVKLVIPTEEEAGKARAEEPSAEAPQKDTAQIGIAADTIFAGMEDGGQTQDGNGRININTASESQLCEIPGIGATRAAAIAAYRESHGAFQKPEDIMKVNGIKEGMYEKIKDSISVD